MFQCFAESLNTIDGRIKNASPEQIPALFNDIPLEVFAMLCWNVEGRIPDLASINQKVLKGEEALVMMQHPWKSIAHFLPTMPAPEDQKKWNGTSGIALMLKSLSTFRTMVFQYQTLTGKTTGESNILDFGCGWGRLLRYFLKNTPQTQLYGTDPWHVSLDRCRQLGLRCNLAPVKWVADSLPFDDTLFDFVYAYSVFTHLSAESTHAALTAIRPRIKPDGLLMITIRPAEYWRLHQISHDPGMNLNEVLSEFNKNGFVFVPHPGKGTPGQVHYGDSAMTLNYIRNNYPEWKIVHVDLNITDPYQIMVYMKPA